MSERIGMPHDHHLERKVLNLALHFDEHRQMLVDELLPSDFYADGTRTVFEAVVSLHKQAGESFDLMTLTSAGRGSPVVGEFIAAAYELTMLTVEQYEAAARARAPSAVGRGPHIGPRLPRRWPVGAGSRGNVGSRRVLATRLREAHSGLSGATTEASRASTWRSARCACAPPARSALGLAFHTPALALATIESITVLGALHASPAVKAALRDRTANT